MLATQGAAHGAAVSAVASWSGPMDLATLVSASRPGSYVHQHPLAYVGGCLPTACGAQYVAASPFDHVTSGTSPMLLANSTQEIIPLSQAQDMDTALIAAHVTQELDVIPGHRHASAYANVELAPTMAFLSTYVTANPTTTSPGQTTTTTSTSTTAPTAPSVGHTASHGYVPILLGLLAAALIAILVGGIRSSRRRKHRYWRDD
jgi:hypothetical protein